MKQAIDARDAMVKRIYCELFQLLVNRINNVLSHGHADSYKNFIGVLDIFGFESFVVNSFEQLCINYCKWNTYCVMCDVKMVVSNIYNLHR